MSKTDWAVLGLNALAAMAAVFGLAAQHIDPMAVGLALALGATFLNSALLIRRSGAARSQERAAERLSPRDDLDARQLLDIDARLEALERAEARTLQALVDEGVVRGPAQEGGEAERVRASRPLQNGR